MAHYKPATGLDGITGALSKKKIQGVNHMTVTRIKTVKDPITGEVVGEGPKEIYAQERRDYKHHPLTKKERAQRVKWREACQAAAEVIKDPSHPRYLEFYQHWRAHVSTAEKPMQFPNFVRAVLVRERSEYSE